MPRDMYSNMKKMDPKSVVRGSEYKKMKKTSMTMKKMPMTMKKSNASSSRKKNPHY